MSENTDPKPITVKPNTLTIKELARLAGVSIGTVDRVLHKRGRVSADNQARIEALVAEHGYQPNLFASHLKSGLASTKTLGILLPHPEQDLGYWGQLKAGFDAAQRELSPLPMVLRFETFDRSSAQDCRNALERLIAAGCDGLALAPIQSTILRPHLEALDWAIPLVFFDTDMELERPHGFVGQDPLTSGRLAGRLMNRSLSAGASALVIRFAGDDEHLRARVEGFRAALSESRREVIEVSQDLGAPAEQRRLDLARVLRTNPAIGGLFVPNAMVGHYVSLGTGPVVIGYDLLPDNVRALRDNQIHYLISQSPETMGREALRLLANALLGRGGGSEHIAMPLEIYVPENLPKG